VERRNEPEGTREDEKEVSWKEGPLKEQLRGAWKMEQESPSLKGGWFQEEVKHVWAVPDVILLSGGTARS
jgi:hypothetical protein